MINLGKDKHVLAKKQPFPRPSNWSTNQYYIKSRQQSINDVCYYSKEIIATGMSKCRTTSLVIFKFFIHHEHKKEQMNIIRNIMYEYFCCSVAAIF